MLPTALREELAAMALLSDDALLAIGYSVAPAERGEAIDALLAQRDAAPLTEAQHAELARLQEASGALMVRKAHAFALLKGRGHPIPALAQLLVPAA